MKRDAFGVVDPYSRNPNHWRCDCGFPLKLGGKIYQGCLNYNCEKYYGRLGNIVAANIIKAATGQECRLSKNGG